MPKSENGKICYIEMPSANVQQSADFYSRVFGWSVRTRGDGTTAFDDGVGQVSGAWKLDKKPAKDPGFIVYVMVDSAEKAVESIKANGGEIVQPIGADAPEITAQFRDPTGNLLGVYQQPG